MEQSNNIQELPSTAQKDEELSRAIIVSLDIEQNFKLYSYRIIDRDTFVSRLTNLLEFLKHSNQH